MQELIVKTTLPALEANFDIVKQQLIDGLKTYDVIITAETVKDGKTMAAEINAIKKAIKAQQIKALEDIMGPVDGFKDKIQELMNLADEARDKISAQVSAYEEKTKAEIQEKIRVFALTEIDNNELREPFFKIEILDLVKLGAVTKTGNLTTATMNMIKGRVVEQQTHQLQDDARIAQEAKDKEDEIERIREEERIKAEAKASTPSEAFNPPQNIMMEQAQNTPPPSENYEEFNPETGEVYEAPAFMDNPREDVQLEVKNGIVIITAKFEVDISSISNITNEQLINAIQNRLKAADVNNSTIVAIQRF